MTQERVPPLRVLQARAEARALLVAVGEIELEAAFAPLVDYATDHSIDAGIAYDIIRAAFKDVIAQRETMGLEA